MIIDEKINILIAPNSMKNCLDAVRFAQIIGTAFRSVSPLFNVREVPVADGGDNTEKILSKALGAEEIFVKVNDPLNRQIIAKYGVAGKTAVVEMADASGMKLLKAKELNPMLTSSFGTGQVILDAISKGCNEIILGVGGSATIDGGAGMLTALGFCLIGENGEKLSGKGSDLIKIKKIQSPKKIDNISIKIVSDVNNPLIGKCGAASVFGPQKGASQNDIEELEIGLKNWSGILEKECGKSFITAKGVGAAGGIALPLLAFYDAQIVEGADYVLSLLDFDKHVLWSDIVITGEGVIDIQTLNNKAPKVVADRAHKQGKIVVAIAAEIHKSAAKAFDGAFSFVNAPVSHEESMKNSEKYIYEFSEELAKMIIVLKDKNKK